MNQPGSQDAVRELSERYNQHAPIYFDLWAPVLRVAGRRLLGELSGRRPRRVLEMGTGVGALLGDIQSTFPDSFLVGLDRSPGMLSRAPAAVPRLLMDATALGLATQSVDLVLAVFMIFHLADPGKGLKEAHRVLRPGGVMGLLTWADHLSGKKDEIWTECLEQQGAGDPDEISIAQHDLVDTPEKMETLLGSAGFRSARCFTEALQVETDVESFVRLKTGMGRQKAQFDNLDSGRQAVCVADARERLARLSSQELGHWGGVVYSLAERA